MFESIISFFKKFGKQEEQEAKSKDTAKERLHLVLMQDRANVSADFLEMMKQEIIDVIKKYIDVDEQEIDVRLTNKTNDDGTTGAPALYANIPIVSIKNENKKEVQNKSENVNKETKEKIQEDKKDIKENKVIESKKTANNEKKETKDNKDTAEESKKDSKENTVVEEKKNENVEAQKESKEEKVSKKAEDAKNESKEKTIKTTATKKAKAKSTSKVVASKKA